MDLSKELRTVLLAVRDQKLVQAYLNGKNNILSNWCSPPDGSILDADNLYHRYFQPVLLRAGLRKIRLHDLRHTFGSLLIQAGASLPYVKEQMGHSSIQVTVDTYGHLIPGANVSFVDKLDTATHKSAHNPHTANRVIPQISPQVIDLVGGGGWTRTSDLRIMRPSL